MSSCQRGRFIILWDKTLSRFRYGFSFSCIKHTASGQMLWFVLNQCFSNVLLLFCDGSTWATELSLHRSLTWTVTDWCFVNKQLMDSYSWKLWASTFICSKRKIKQAWNNATTKASTLECMILFHFLCVWTFRTDHFFC